MNCRQLWMDMCRERLTQGLLLRLGILLTAVCVSIHVYLEAGWRGTPAPLAVGHPIRSCHNCGQQSRSKRVSAEPGAQGRSIKRRISYVRMLKKDSPAEKRDGDKEDPSLPCCPPLLSQKKAPRWHIHLEPWASENHSLEDEARRFLNYITTPQVSCVPLPGEETALEGNKGAWTVCLDPKYSLTHRVQSKHCRVYSFGLGVDDRSLEHSLARKGCEVHCFDPSLKQPHLQHAEMWLHRLSVDWRDPNPAIAAQRQYASTKKLATILNDFGHRQDSLICCNMQTQALPCASYDNTAHHDSFLCFLSQAPGGYTPIYNFVFLL
ncbi:methyltransferase-like protein 24 isoform X2 [Thunnus maccoyii]|uniref:methyltransferase-like protein 24 isoform X2 n=1 Tax=Thunnus maccoyii TaxID=8240 RepID=UPI001C4B357E|nr:methyltransferase-like protein 24 isoform X2 [Thunnus maccoyii]